MNHFDLSPLEIARFNMIEQQIRPWNVLEPRVLELLAQIKREDFVPAPHQSLAFMDVELPLGDSGAAMLAPKVQARMVQDLKLCTDDTVLEIGAGTGYMTALMARLSKHVLALEINPQLANIANENLRHAVVANADVQVGDGSKVSAIAGEFDVIVLAGSVAKIPEELIAKLKMGGRLMAIVGAEPVMRATLIQRTPEGLVTTEPWDTVAARLSGFAESERFQF